MIKKKISIGCLKEGDIFKYKGIIYEIMYKHKWKSLCRYINSVYDTNKKRNVYTPKYLECFFSNYTMVEQ